MNTTHVRKSLLYIAEDAFCKWGCTVVNVVCRLFKATLEQEVESGTRWVNFIYYSSPISRYRRQRFSRFWELQAPALNYLLPFAIGSILQWMLCLYLLLVHR